MCVRVSGLGVGDIVVADTGVGDIYCFLEMSIAFIYCFTILGVFMTPPSGFIVVHFSAYFSALFMQLLYASFCVLLY